MNWTATINDDVTSAGNGGISKLRSGMRPLASEIAVDISIEMVVTSRLQDQTTVPCEVKIATKLFDCVLVSVIWVVDISGTHMHCHQNIQVSVLC